ncbi:MAG: hypothetical protein ABH807_00060 [Candidatus Shapirobacteria bacterium]
MTLAAGLVSEIGGTLDKMPSSVSGFWKGPLDTLFGNLATTALTAAVILALMLALYGAIRWVTSAGDKEGLATAQKIITAAIVGLVIAFSVWGVFSLVRGFFGIGRGGSAGSPSGGGGGPSAGTSACVAVCKNTSCQGYNSFCYSDCRCICNSSGQMWAYETPWCDVTDTIHECVGNSSVDTGKKCK